MVRSWYELDEVDSSEIRFVVMITEYQNQIIIIRNKKRELWELPGGKREEGEDLIQAACRELYEETGALECELTPFGVYLMNGSYGMNFFAKVNVLGPLPDYEIEEITFVTELPENLLYGPVFYDMYAKWKGCHHRELETYTCHYKNGENMDRYRYPIGQFVPTPEPTQALRDSWIEAILEIPATLRNTVQSLTMEQLHTPYRPGGWTVQQVVHHMADNDMNAYIRFKKAITEDSPLASSYREDSWAELGDYRNTRIETSLVLLEALHSRFADLLRSLHPSDFQRTFTSPTHGIMSLDIATQRFAWHGQHHIAQIRSLKERTGW